jgi:hypothetical protein
VIGKPVREDQVAKWLWNVREDLKAECNRCPSKTAAAQRDIVDALLSRYNECADYGLRLDDEGGDP